jgi:hypothetical protein
MACTKADPLFGGIPQANFLSNCTAPGAVFCLATGNMLPDVNLTLLEGIGVDRVGNMKN